LNIQFSQGSAVTDLR